MLNRLEDTLVRLGSVSATFSSQLEIDECAEILTNIRRETVLVCLQKYHPSSISELKKRLNEEGIRSADEDLLEIVRELQSDGEIGLLDPVMLDSFPRFLLDASNSWAVYAVVSFSILELFLVAYPTQNTILVSLRLLFGLGLLGFLPGYSTVQILFPTNELHILEKLLLSIFLYGRFQRVSFHWLCYCGNHLCFSSKIFRVKSHCRQRALKSPRPDYS